MTHANGVAGADYAGGGIFNLMQSVAQACGAPASGHAQCAALPAERLAEARHLVLFVIARIRVGIVVVVVIAVVDPIRVGAIVTIPGLRHDGP